MILREAFDYACSQVSPTGPHIDPCHIAIYELLVVRGRGHRALPGLAERWDVSEDGLEWRFHLRPGARFHTGAPLTAEAVLAPLATLRDSFNSGPLWYWDPVESMWAEGERTVAFRTRYPYVRLPSLLWGTHSTIYNEATRAADPEGFGFSTADGTGPFRFVSWSPELVVAERFAAYDGPAPHLDRIEWHAILDPDERLAALERGDVDVLHGPPLEAVDALREEGRLVVVEQPQASSIYLGLDWQRSDLGFDDVRVREAIALAVDREAIVREAFAGHATPTWGPIPPGDEHYDPAVDAGRRRDVARARELLAAARGGEPIRCECVVQDDAQIGAAGRLLAAQLAEVGVELELRFEKPFAPFYAVVDAHPPAFVSKWLWPDGVDAALGFLATRCIGFPNWQHSSIPELDTAFEAWLRAGSPDELRDAASLVQRIAVRDFPTVPLVSPTDIWVHSRRLVGFEPYPEDLYPRYDQARLIDGR